MGFDGSGNYSRTNGTYTGSSVWASDSGAAVKITSARHDTHDQDIAAALTSCITKTGLSTPSANIPFGGFKATNIGAATARTDAIQAAQVQDGSVIWGGTTGGAANVQTASLTPSLTAYVTGQRYKFIAGFGNTGALTLNLNALGAKAVTDRYNIALNGYEIPALSTFEVTYDGTSFRLDIEAISTWAPTYSASGAMTITANATTFALFKRRGSTVWFKIFVTVTTGGTANTEIRFTLPVNSQNAQSCLTAFYSDGGANIPGVCTTISATTFAVSKVDGTNWALAAGRTILVCGEYQVGP